MSLLDRKTAKALAEARRDYEERLAWAKAAFDARAAEILASTFNIVHPAAPQRFQ
ncbi:MULTISPECIES: hypothetical protein [unclassified Mesorhizobium]|uniref:hypothetical protein n=1 Tax=unclassified Mesorhizobium TaxID=325217 RepID=UPI001678E346|nr:MULTISPECIES: hypothetical protein [unclassified Mesorhizobium]